jgi:hypothetical protein
MVVLAGVLPILAWPIANLPAKATLDGSWQIPGTAGEGLPAVRTMTLTQGEGGHGSQAPLTSTFESVPRSGS